MIFAILAVGVLIILHEAGHYLVARWAGMNVSRFSVGFGPALYSTHWRGTDFQIGAIPLGGFVQIDGMSIHDGTDPNAPGSYQNKPFHLKFATILAGPVANYLLGFGLLVVGYGFFHDQALGPIRVTKVVAGSAAAKAGLKEGDLLVGTSSSAFTTEEDFRAAIQAADPDLLLEVRRGDAQLRIPTTPEVRGEVHFLGVSYEGSTRRRIDLSLGETLTMASQEVLLNTLGTLLIPVVLLKASTRAQVEVSGPIGIVKSLSERAQKSLSDALKDIARLSVGLGVFNLLPIPSLDGSRLLFLAVGAVRRRPVSPKVEQVVHLVGLALLLGIFVIVSIGDVLGP